MQRLSRYGAENDKHHTIRNALKHSRHLNTQASQTSQTRIRNMLPRRGIWMIMLHGNLSGRNESTHHLNNPSSVPQISRRTHPAALLALSCSKYHPPVEDALAVSLPTPRLNAQLWPIRAVIERNSVCLDEVVQVGMTIGASAPAGSVHNV